MNSLTAEKQYQLAKWADIIKSCKSSGMMVSEWLKQNNVSKDQYYYWQRKLKDACLESLQEEQVSFVELPVEASRGCTNKPVTKKATIKSTTLTPENNVVATTLKIAGANIDIYDNASPQFIRNFAEAFMYIK